MRISGHLVPVSSSEARRLFSCGGTRRGKDPVQPPEGTVTKANACSGRPAMLMRGGLGQNSQTTAPPLPSAVALRSSPSLPSTPPLLHRKELRASQEREKVSITGREGVLHLPHCSLEAHALPEVTHVCSPETDLPGLWALIP